MKSELPENVRTRGLARYIKRFNEVVFTDRQIDELLRKIQHHVNTSTTTRREHVNNLRKRHNSKSTCPNCGSSLVKRVARTGSNIGKTFWGCSGFPECRFTRN